MKLEKQKKQIAAQMWLQYFNQTLYSQGLISEAERNKLALRIDNLPLSGDEYKGLK